MQCVAFAGASHVLLPTDDGAIAVHRRRDWTLLHEMKGHKNAVVGIAVHPSARMALSVAGDNTMRMWDLTRGRLAFTKQLRASASAVRFDASGACFGVIIDAALVVSAVGFEGSLPLMRHPRRVLCFAFLSVSHCAYFCPSPDE